MPFKCKETDEFQTMAFPNDGKKYEPGESGNPAGRPRKWVSSLKEQGYKLSEINDALQVLMSMNESELEEVKENDKATGLEKAVAGAILNSIKKGSLYNIETLISRLWGKPKEMTEAKGTQKIIVEYVNPNTALSTPSGSEED